MRIAILYDGQTVAEWQRRAIELVAADHEILLLIAGGPAPRRKRMARHALYYALNLVTIRNPLTRRVALPPMGAAGTLHFHPGYDGYWAVLPETVLAWLDDRGVDAIVKFGLDLLRIPEGAPPILSYHHGDPRAYRGRPAGFYELANGEPFVGQIVQRLSNTLDAGEVLAFAETRAHRHSYRKTLIDAYTLSPHLLPQALARLAQRETLPVAPSGRQYRLPGNGAVARAAARSAWLLAKRLAYGAFIEKRWRVSRIACDPAEAPATLVGTAERAFDAWITPPLLPGYTFYADGFFHDGPGDILVEALNKVTGKGELVRVRDGSQERVASPPGTHLSYPLTFASGGHRYVVPEAAGWSCPAIFSIEQEGLRKVRDLDIDAAAILDPTLVEHEGRIFLFGNVEAQGTSILHLWSAPSLFGRFELHPASPIRVSARGSRMAGAILAHGDQRFRLGQDCRRAYGDGILIFRIEELSDRAYRESFAGEAAFARVHGPHTLNREGENLLFDWYVERFSPFAGLRRLRNKL